MSVCLRCHGEFISCNRGCDAKDRFTSPLLLIGTYIAAASLICTLLMSIDLIRSFKTRRFWVPCRFFHLNAASIALLTIATKLPVDLTEPMPSSTNQLAKLSSNVFFCIALANFMPSVAKKDVFTDIIALAILVITVFVNIVIQFFTGLIVYLVIEHAVIICLMIFLLAILTFSALSVSSMKKDLEIKYREMCETLTFEKEGKRTVDHQEIKDHATKIWMMVQTSTGQFAMARSVTSSASGAICFLAILVLLEAEIRMYATKNEFKGYSAYKWSTHLILVVQSVGSLVGVIAPALRWFITLSFENPMYYCNSSIDRNVFGAESHWTRSLEMLKDSPLKLKIRRRKGRKLAHETKDFILTICIRIQIVIVVCCKCVRLVLVVFLDLSFWWYYLFKSCFVSGSYGDEPGSESSREYEQLRRFALQLDGEERLPKRVLKHICETVDIFLEYGRNHRPRHLAELLKKASSFNGETTLNCVQVPYLLSLLPETPNCSWSLQVATLTSIAIALSENPNVCNLSSSVTEGLFYVGVVEKHLCHEKHVSDRRNAALITWEGVELQHRWLDQDLKGLSGKSCRDTLRILVDVAENKLKHFRNTFSGSRHRLDEEDELMLDWPAYAVASKSMEKIGKSLLAEIEGGDKWTRQRLFGSLCGAIADLFCYCLSHLPEVVVKLCSHYDSDEREEYVAHAIRIIGETEDVMKIINNLHAASSSP